VRNRSKAPRGVSARTDSAGLHELESIIKGLRRDVVEMTFAAGSGHPGGSLSEMEILAALYFRVMRHDPKNPSWPDRDRFILSKGHACPGLYAVLARCGYFPREELWTFRKIGSRIQGHAHTMTPGVEMNSGSLGQGLSFAVGTALAARLDGKGYRVYALLGDGECDEGQVWEAAMSAAHYKLDNLTAFVDRNRIQNDRFTSQVMQLEPLGSKWRAFGWRVLEIDGHDLSQVLDAVGKAQRTRGRPSVIVARTVKGKGVSFMENNPDFHGRAPNKEEYERALRELA
jgi:transketolase